MPYAAKILADSVAPHGARLTTFEVTYPLIIHGEFMTHRDFSRNAASSRAIPVKRMIEMVENDPFIPERFPENQKGMQAQYYYNAGTPEYEIAKAEWLHARDNALDSVRVLIGAHPAVDAGAGAEVGAGPVYLNVHKQIANRLLIPWQWITVVVSSTRFSNFFALRCDPLAQPEIQLIAYMMRDLYEKSEPKKLEPGEWHIPYLDPELEQSIPDDLKISVARCARVSYFTHPTDDQPAKIPTIAEDFALHDRLISSGHWSPTEHVATPAAKADHRSGNFLGWEQYRKTFAGECR